MPTMQSPPEGVSVGCVDSANEDLFLRASLLPSASRGCVVTVTSRYRGTIKTAINSNKRYIYVPYSQVPSRCFRAGTRFRTYRTHRYSQSTTFLDLATVFPVHNLHNRPRQPGAGVPDPDPKVICCRREGVVFPLPPRSFILFY